MRICPQMSFAHSYLSPTYYLLVDTPNVQLRLRSGHKKFRSRQVPQRKRNVYFKDMGPPPIEEEQDSAKRTTTAVDMNVSKDFCPNDHPT